jgi:hypothetical protein
MNYDIVWDVKAYRKLEQIWDKATPIGPAVDAFDEIERRLRLNPATEGESRASGRRITIVAPLGVIFRVNERLKEVHILDVWMFESHK